VNRKLVTTVLHKRGHVAVAVEHGRAAVEALAAARGSAFDLVILDLQMPVMGGLEAAQAIRTAEAGRTRIPIVALTAHAMRGDRERCLAAGMDEYLSKPIDVDLLIATVERLGTGSSDVATPNGGSQTPRSVAHVTFAEDDALRRTSGDRKLLKKLIALYRADARVSVRKIANALRRRQPDALRVAAHALKGSVATVGGMAARDAAARLEHLGHTGNLKQAGAALTLLRAELVKLDKAFVRAHLVTRGRTR